MKEAKRQKKYPVNTKTKKGASNVGNLPLSSEKHMIKNIVIESTKQFF